MSREHRLCKRDAMLIYLVHWMEGIVLTPFVVFSLRSSLYEFFFLLDPCLRMNRPVLSNTGVVLVSKRVVPHFPHLRSYPELFLRARRRHGTGPLGWGLECHGKVCQETSPVLSLLCTSVCSLPGCVSGRSCCLMANNHGPLLGTLTPSVPG